MLIRRKRGWELPEAAATPEAVYLKRRDLARGLAAGSILAASAGVFAAGQARAQAAESWAPEGDPTGDLYPVARNERYTVERPLTSYEHAATYNNYYEFGSHKQIWRAAQRLAVRPWTVTFDGMVEEERTVDIDTLIRAMPLEERVYRHRCVEAWSMIVPWTGFPMADLVDYARPLSSARYVRMETFSDSTAAPGQREFYYPWPYIEGLTMEEATNELTLMVTGLYGQPLPMQNGAPLRMHAPWKYGFKHSKGIVRFTFTDQRPVGFWEDLQAREYGFWANVNPQVPHPRWSQATERVLGTNEQIPTQLYNGYGEFVAQMYEGMEGERLFM